MNRYVVADLNVLEEGLSRYVQPDDQIVLPHASLSDLAGATPERLAKHTKLFQQWYRDKGDQIWIPYLWQKLEEKEHLPRDRTIGVGWRDDMTSGWLRRMANNPNVSFAERLRAFPTSIEYEKYEAKRTAMVEICERFADSKSLKRNRPDIFHKLHNEDFITAATEIIQEPHWGAILALAPGNEHYRTVAWRDALNLFPDIKAIGRMSRIIIWYALELASGRTSGFGNNLEDSEYAFTASYTYSIATNDKRLRDLLRAAFPSVSIISRSPA